MFTVLWCKISILPTDAFVCMFHYVLFMFHQEK